MKPAACSKAFGPSPETCAQVSAGTERTVGIPVGDDAGRQFGTDARHMGQQGRAGGVDIHADVVDHAFDHAVQGVAEGSLVHIVLVQADADGLGVDLDQFGQRVLGAAGDGDRAADGHIQVGEFLAGQGRGGIDRRAGFVDDQVFDRLCHARVSSATSFSVSREAVPLPMVMSVTWWRLTMSSSVVSAPVQSFFGSCG